MNQKDLMLLYGLADKIEALEARVVELEKLVALPAKVEKSKKVAKEEMA